MSLELNIPIEDPSIIAYWVAKAEKNGHSLDEEVGRFMQKNAYPVGEIVAAQKRQSTREHFDRELKDLRNRIQETCGVIPDSTQLIRQMRDE